jgi:L-seryl-tRNA(Ser) seleniumtransferase
MRASRQRPGLSAAAELRVCVPLRTGHAVRRGALPAVVGRIEDGRLLLDLRAVAPADDELIVSAVRAAAG